MKKKLLYEVPEAEQFFVKYEENIMSPNNSWDQPATSTSIWGDEGDDNGME